MSSPIEFYRSSGGARIYRFPLELFPILKGFAYLVIAGEIVALIDVGSGFGDSNGQLDAGITALRTQFDEKIGWEDLTHILITHGHIDHFGGLHFVRERSNAKIGIHELDFKVLARYEERVAVTAKSLREYLIEAGVDQERREGIMNMYLFNKVFFSSLTPDFTFESVGMSLGPLRMFHVPGHCPGHVVIQVDDVLFSGDHILLDTSPHQAPERLTLNTGLEHYIASLNRTHDLGAECSQTFGGHGGVMNDLRGRIDEILEVHQERLEQVSDLLDEPKTVVEVADALFPDVEGYDQLLALEETGAHIEYLEQRGYLEIANEEDLERDSVVSIRYRRTTGLEGVSLPIRFRSEERNRRL
ncbi:MAG: MBL fold metallo-hydrolase [Anaerolineales bacterium]|nr:MBL fold metallo-hydrolase [Anaerolineales bacterium]